MKGVDVGVSTEEYEEFTVPNPLAFVESHRVVAVKVVVSNEGKFLKRDNQKFEQTCVFSKYVSRLKIVDLQRLVLILASLL